MDTGSPARIVVNHRGGEYILATLHINCLKGNSLGIVVNRPELTSLLPLR